MRLISPVNLATLAATFSANPTRAFNPVPTAVPPTEQSNHAADLQSKKQKEFSDLRVYLI